MSEELTADENQHSVSKNTLSLSSNTAELDLSLLSPDAQEEIRKAHALGEIELIHKAKNMGLETRELDENLKNFEATVADATRNGSHAQVTKTQNNSLGRTEVIIGNTGNAAKGKFTKTQSGEKDNTLIYALLGFAALVVIILLAK
jgi:hypothetical protein